MRTLTKKAARKRNHRADEGNDEEEKAENMEDFNFAQSTVAD